MDLPRHEADRSPARRRPLSLLCAGPAAIRRRAVRLAAWSLASALALRLISAGRLRPIRRLRDDAVAVEPLPLPRPGSRPGLLPGHLPAARGSRSVLGPHGALDQHCFLPHRFVRRNRLLAAETG